MEKEEVIEMFEQVLQEYTLEELTDLLAISYVRTTIERDRKHETEKEY